MHRGPAAYVLDPPPSRGRDLELEGGVNACHVEYVYDYESQDSHVRGTVYCLSVLVKLRFRLGPVSYQKPLAHCTVR